MNDFSRVESAKEKIVELIIDSAKTGDIKTVEALEKVNKELNA